jgi:hypothetical protein
MVTIKGKGFKIPGLMIAFCLGVTLSVNSQIKAPQITPLSPNAASLWKYTELPVNMFTGVPSINIPIYEIKTGSLSVPVALSYHAGGIRYEDQASWTGLGWTLSAGGSINRNVKGVADEKPEGLLNSVTAINFSASNCDYSYFENALNKVFDTQPDEFSYNLPSKTGRFVFKQGVQHPITIPYAPIKVGYTISSPSGFTNMSITDENGIIHHFGQTETTTGGSGIFVEDNFPSTWLLTQMQSADLARAINFNYVAGAGTVHKSTKTDYIRVVDNVVGGAHTLSACYPPPTPTIYGYVTTNLSYTTTTKYLSDITFDNGKIEFVQSSGYRTDIANNQKMLEYIRIYALRDGAYTLLKSVRFYYSYFKKLNNAVLQDYKLKLDSIHILGSDASVQERYSFQYHTTNFSGDKNNPQDINAQDWWGYYNGKTTNTNMIPQQTITFLNGTSSQVSIGGADRNVDPAYLTEGVLKRITYPTGGYTEFEFETHQFYESGAKYAGGIRVKKITSLASANDVPLIKTYKYGLGGNGYGQKMFSNYMGYYVTEDKRFCWQTITHTANLSYTERYFSSVSSMQLDGYDGSPVVYPYVTEYAGTESTNNGKTEYVYDNGSPIGDNFYFPYSSVTNIFQRQSNHYLRGFLTNKTVYNVSNGKVSEASTNYQTIHPIDTLVGLLIDQRFNFVAEDPGGCWTDNGTYKYSFNTYPLRSGSVQPIKITEIAFNPGDPGRSVTNEVNYAYDANYLVPTEINKNFRKLQTGFEEQQIEYRKYPFSYTFSGAPSGGEAQGIKLLQDKNISTAIVEQYAVRRFKDPSVWQTEITGGYITTYRSNKPYADKVWEIETTAPISSASFGTGSTIVSNAFSKNAAYREKLIYGGYDAFGNIVQYNKVYDVTNTYLWDYNNLLPVAEVTNADSVNIAFTSFEAENKGNWTFTGTPSADATSPTGRKAYVLNGSNNITKTGLTSGTTYVVSYWIKNTSPLTITGTVGSAVAGRTLGLWKHYEHRVTGQTTVTISGSFAIDELRLHPVGSLMTTFTHEPLIGISSHCDDANRILYYEYDSIGRLLIARDQNRNIVKTYEYKYKTP